MVLAFLHDLKAQTDAARRAELAAIARQHGAILAGPWDRSVSIPTSAARWIGAVVRATHNDAPQPT